MRRGRVLWFNLDKGFGVIVGDDGKSYFAHFSEIRAEPTEPGEKKRLAEQAEVTFTAVPDETRFNIPRAKNISEI